MNLARSARRLRPASLVTAVSLLLLAQLVVPVDAEARIYRWVDEHGSVHFSDMIEQVPVDQRPGAREAAEHLEEAPVTVLPVASPSLPSPSAPPDAVRVGGARPFDAAFDEDAAPEGVARLEAPPAQLELLVGGLSVFGVLLALGVLSLPYALVLLLSCRVARVDGRGMGAVLLASVLVLAVGMAVGAGAEWILAGAGVGTLALSLVRCVLGLGATVGVLRLTLVDTVGRSLLVALVANGIMLLMGLAAIFGMMALLGGAAAFG